MMGAAWMAALSANGPPSVILARGIVLSMSSPSPLQFQAIALSGERVLALGTNDEILALTGPGTRVIDLAGRTVLPGFVDAHAHLLRDAGSAGLTLGEAQDLALSFGITTAAEMVVEPGDVERYVDAAARGEVRVRTRLFLAYNGLCGDVYGPWYEAYSPFVEIAPRLSIAGVKMFVERSSCEPQRPAISFSDALRSLLSPAGAFWYGSDRPLFTADELAAVIERAARSGFPVALHAIGDAAVETALRALQDAGREEQMLRPLVLHNLLVRDELLRLYSEVGATPVVEPVNACFVDAYDDMLPPTFAGIVRRWGDLAASTARMAAGSDWPWGDAGSLSPLFRLANLVSPQNASPGYASWEPCAALSDRQTLSVEQALRTMTADAAWALHLENEIGTLEPGKEADLVILSGNPLTTPIEDLGTLRVEATLVGGRIAWSREPPPP